MRIIIWNDTDHYEHGAEVFEDKQQMLSWLNRTIKERPKMLIEGYKAEPIRLEPITTVTQYEEL